MVNLEMDINTVLVASGIPTAITGFFFWQIKRILEKKDKERERVEQNRQQNELLIIKGLGASLALSEATAAAVQRIPNANCNGEMQAALEYARKIKHEHKDFLYEKAVDSILE